MRFADGTRYETHAERIMREADKVTARQWLGDIALGLAACVVAYGLALVLWAL